jgi:3-oxoacyl-[acyl-carrier-protein] synthase II
MKNNNHHIAITGLGCVSPLGIGVEKLWRGLAAGQSGIAPIKNFDISAYKSHLGGEVRDFNPKDFVEPMKARRMDRTSLLAIAAAKEALSDAGLDPKTLDRDRTGVILGTGFGSTSSTEEFCVGLLTHGPAGTNPMLFPSTVPNAPASQVAIELGLRGPNSTVSQKEASGEEAIGFAYHTLLRERADILLSGGVDELSYILFHGHSALGALSPGRRRRGPEGSFPFDRRANGIVLAEGAGILVLEPAEKAQNRQAKIHARILGYGMAAGYGGVVAYDRDPRGMVQAINLALKQAQLEPGQIDGVLASANSTGYLDRLETEALKIALGQRAPEIPICALKSMLGHFDALGGIKAVTACLVLEEGLMPPTINLDTPDEGCDLDYVRGSARPGRYRHLLVTGFSHGGTHTCLLLGK